MITGPHVTREDPHEEPQHHHSQDQCDQISNRVGHHSTSVVRSDRRGHSCCPIGAGSVPEASPGRIHSNFRGFWAKRAVLAGIRRISPTRSVCNFFAAEAPRLRVCEETRCGIVSDESETRRMTDPMFAQAMTEAPRIDASMARGQVLHPYISRLAPPPRAASFKGRMSDCKT